MLLLGTVPGGLAGLALESTAEDAFRSPELVAAMLLLFCVPMLVAERLGSRSRDAMDVGAIDALIVGAAQAVALVPGVSRSGITISAGMLRGLRRDQAAVFAFLLSAPIIAAAGGKQLLDIARGEGGGSGLENEYAVYAAGLITAGLVGYAAIYVLVRFLRTNALYVFIIYRVALAFLVLSLAAAGVF
jgi:undecaprenyl-diphosphatase